MEPKELFEFMESGVAKEVLIVDVRPKTEFSNCNIIVKNNIQMLNIPEKLIKPG